MDNGLFICCEFPFCEVTMIQTETEIKIIDGKARRKLDLIGKDLAIYVVQNCSVRTGLTIPIFEYLIFLLLHKFMQCLSEEKYY